MANTFAITDRTTTQNVSPHLFKKHTLIFLQGSVATRLSCGGILYLVRNKLYAK